MPASLTTDSSFRQRLHEEQVRLLYASVPAAIAGNLFLGGLAAAVQWSVIDPRLTIAWLALLCTVLAARAALFLLHRHDQETNHTPGHAWLQRFRVGAIATGTCWGLAALMMFPANELAHEVFLAFVVAGVSAGAITSLSVDRWSALGFVVPALFPLAVVFVNQGNLMAVAMGLMVAAYLLFVVASALRIQRQVEDNVRLRSEAVDRENSLAHQQHLTEVIARAQSQFIQQADRRSAFDGLLSDILDLTRSEYGFIGEVLKTAEGEPYLKTYAITNIAWNDDTRAFYEANAPKGMEFFNLKTLFGAALTSGEPVIANHPQHDPRGGGLPEGHPPLNAFLGIPIRREGELVAMLGIANRAGGYDKQLLDFLQPLLVTIGQLVEAARTHRQHLDSERRLRGIIEGTRIGTWEWNVQTGETVFNERWAEIVGYTLDELQPMNIQTWLDLAHPDDLKMSGDLLEKHFSGESDYYDCQCRMRHKDGHWVWVHDRGRVVSWTDDGKPLLMSGTHADITDQKRAEQALNEQAEHTRAILDNMVDGIITIDPEGLIESFNPAAEKIFGYEAAEVLGHNVSILMPSPHREAHDRYLHNYRESAVARIIGIGREVEGQRKDGSVFPMDLAVSETTRSGRPMYVGMVRDISDRKRIERMKNEFVSTVSHELRTPLTSISGALGLVSEGALGELPDQAKEMIGIARKNSQRLSHLINDLLDIEKLAVGKMYFDMRPQRLMPLIEQAVEINRSYGAERHVRLRLETTAPEVKVRVDAQRFMQVMSNLLSNAIKYSPEDGIVDVSMGARAGRARVTVVDHGHGIPEEFRSRIFEKFAQADSSDTRQQGGTGLGLAITRELVERMGGTIGFESVEGEGASFFFELPLWESARIPARREQERASGHGTPSVLIVEDDPAVSHLLALLLERSGYAVDVVANGHDALTALRTSQYDAVTLDLMLPDISGLEIIRRVRLDPRTADLPFVVISGKMEEGRLAINGEFTGIEWLAKPVEEPQLIDAVARVTADRQQTRVRVLHVEDDPEIHEVVRVIAGNRFNFALAGTLAEARARIAKEKFDVVILDLELPDGSAWSLLPEIRMHQRGARVVVLSGTEISRDEAREVERSLLKSQISPAQLLDAISSQLRNLAAEEVSR